MPDDQRQAVIQGFCGVMAKMAFMFAEPVDSPDRLPPAVMPMRRARLRFSGALRGTIELAMPKIMCIEVAANMLGDDLDDPRATARGDDAFCELLNVACGRILTGLAGEQLLFTLGTPEAAEIDGAALQLLRTDAGTLGFSIDGSPALLRFILEQSP